MQHFSPFILVQKKNPDPARSHVYMVSECVCMFYTLVQGSVRNPHTYNTLDRCVLCAVPMYRRTLNVTFATTVVVY